MKKLLLVLCSFFLVFSSVHVDAMGGGGGRGKKSDNTEVATFAARTQPVEVLNPGPHLMFTSDGAWAFYIDVVGVTDQPLDYEPTEPDGNTTSIALGEFNLEDGLYEVDIHGNNDIGNSDIITFDLTVKTHGQNRTWTIIPNQEIANQDPEYMKKFELESLKITLPKTIRMPK